MSAYLWQLMALAILCGVGGLLLPGGENGAYGKHWRLLCGVSLALLLLSPLSSLARGGLDLAAYVRAYVEEVQKNADALQEEASDRLDVAQMDAQLAAGMLRETLCAQFSIEREEITVSVRLSESGEALDSVYIGLSGRAIWQDTGAMQAWIDDALGCRAQIYLE